MGLWYKIIIEIKIINYYYYYYYYYYIIINFRYRKYPIKKKR